MESLYAGVYGEAEEEVSTVDLLPCPFCGSHDIDPAGWASAKRSGPACMDCSGSADTIDLWNSRSQLPTGMEHCTIEFISCPVGHGRLTASNWLPSDCKSCEIERLRKAIQVYLDGNWGTRLPRKTDKCPHGHFEWEACEGCIDEYFQALLGPQVVK